MNKVTETLKNRKLQFVDWYKIYFEELKKNTGTKEIIGSIYNQASFT